MANANRITIQIAVDSKGGITNLQSFNKEIDDTNRQLEKTAGISPAVSRGIMSIYAAAAALVGMAGGMTGIAYGVLRVNSQFENFNIQLETILGSSEKARQAMGWIEEFTAKTPFELSQVTEAFVLLQSIGMDATKALGGIGNAAASMNRSLLDTVTAIVSMEREVLRRYGIDFRQAGDEATFIWQDRTGKMVETTVKGGQAIQRETLLSIWNERYAGGMERFQATFTGMWSNVKDNATKFIRLIGEAGLFDEIKKQAEITLKVFNEFLETGRAEAWAASISSAVTTTWNAFEMLGRAIYTVVKLLIEYKDIIIALAAAKAAHLIVSVLSAITVFGKFGWVIKNLGFIIRYFATVTLPALITPLGLVAAAIGAVTYAYLKMRDAQNEAKRKTEEFKLSLQGMNKELLQSKLYATEYALAKVQLRKEQAAAMPQSIFGIPMTELTRKQIERGPEQFIALTKAQRKYKEAVIEERTLLQQQEAIRKQLATIKDADKKATNALTNAINVQTSAINVQADAQNNLTDLAKQQLADRWAKVHERLFFDIAKAGETEHMQKMIDLLWEVSKLREKFGDKPIIQQWFDIKRAEIEKKQAEEAKGLAQKQNDKLAEFERQLTEAKQTEVQKRISAEEKWVTVQEGLLIKAGIDYEERQQRMIEVRAIAAKRISDIEKEHLEAVKEARLRYELAEIDAAEKARTITKEQALRQRIDLEQSLLFISEQRLARLDPEKDAAAYYAQADAVQKLRGNILQLNEALKEQTGTLTEGLVEGLKRYIERLNTAFQNGLVIAEQITKGMENAFMNFFDKTSEGFMNFGKLAMSILNDIYKALIRTLIVQPLVSAITKGIGGIFGGGGRLSPGTIIGDFIPIGHSGGLVAQHGIVPKFHWGGLANDEVPAILQRGEYVVSRRGVAALDAINQGKVSGGDVNVIVNVENQTGVPVDAKQGSVRFDGENYIVNVIMKNIDGYGPLRHAIAGVR